GGTDVDLGEWAKDEHLIGRTVWRLSDRQRLGTGGSVDDLPHRVPVEECRSFPFGPHSESGEIEIGQVAEPVADRVVAGFVVPVQAEAVEEDRPPCLEL